MNRRKICTEVLERITPKKRERTRIEALAKKLQKKVAFESKKSGVEADVRLEGSIAKDTWLSKETDIDIFMRVPTTLPRKFLGEVCLKIARKATEGSEQVERFAEHPYLEAVTDDAKINVVPCYKVEQGEWLSATDRTPFHTDYVKRHLQAKMKGEVRLLKKFMKEVNVYGAEIKVGGFSGYLCELLILNFGSFVNTLESFAEYENRLIIDIEGHYEGRENEVKLLFKEPLVLIDPVDRGRNVASAVRPRKLYDFIAASRVFLRDPDIKFFYPQGTVALPAEKLKQRLLKRGLTIVFLTLGKIDTVPDILWGQLYKSQRSLHRMIQLENFKILRDTVWSDEKSINIFILELEGQVISPIKIHLGPPLEKKSECERFVKKHLASPNTVSGPYIKEGRWVVEIRRKYTDVSVLLKAKLKDGGRRVGIAEKISDELRKGFDILVNQEIMGVYKKNGEFAKCLTEFLSGKPKWLQNS